MKGLLIKDFYMAKKNLFMFIILPYITLFLSFYMKSLFYANYFVIILSLIPVYIIALDETYKWNKYETLLPTKKTLVVIEKYFLLLLSVLPYILIHAVLLFIFRENVHTVISEVSVLLFMGIAVPSVLLPITFKMGYIKARIFSTIIIHHFLTFKCWFI